jgi:hypothetical protein
MFQEIGFDIPLVVFSADMIHKYVLGPAHLTSDEIGFIWQIILELSIITTRSNVSVGSRGVMVGVTK